MRLNPTVNRQVDAMARAVGCSKRVLLERAARAYYKELPQRTRDIVDAMLKEGEEDEPGDG